VIALVDRRYVLGNNRFVLTDDCLSTCIASRIQAGLYANIYMYIGKLATCNLKCIIVRCFRFLLFLMENSGRCKAILLPLYSERKLEQYIGKEGIKTSIVRMSMYNTCLILLHLRVIYFLGFK
jgi:hypothetical protein